MTSPPRRGWAVPLWGAVAALLTAPLAAAVVACVYRFPVPFAEYARGPSGAADAALASVFYLILGGALVLALAGAVVGMLVQRGSARNPWRSAALTTLGAFAVATVAAVVLATLEFVIGPW
ncbi:hypothetical protein [Nocardia sp. N2S4-5]|uniref:hypothetical protein n=1 Tax=Nocardia sp. N2S4-5 TaxID=3351565 RepID=UPI0037D82D75